tara:strand:+ start:183 stop:464 length:282 start_codon:yes stop_codon:yes gene_type:complete
MIAALEKIGKESGVQIGKAWAFDGMYTLITRCHLSKSGKKGDEAESFNDELAVELKEFPYPDTSVNVIFQKVWDVSMLCFTSLMHQVAHYSIL